MEPGVIPSFSKNKSSKTENQWTHTHHQSSHEGFERSQHEEKDNKQVYVMAYLAIEKKVMSIVHKCQKMVFKGKRLGFRNILNKVRESKCDNYGHRTAILPQISKLEKDSNMQTPQAINSELTHKQTIFLCIKKSELTLQKLISTLQKHRLRVLLSSWTFLKSLNHSTSNDHPHYPPKNNLHESDLMSKGASIVSKKRKNTKGKDEHKENSYHQSSDLSAQNQRLRHEILHDEEEKEIFIEQLSDLLDHHEKYLHQGSSTTRTKKHK